jgi:hypothetical protein
MPREFNIVYFFFLSATLQPSLRPNRPDLQIREPNERRIRRQNTYVRLATRGQLCGARLTLEVHTTKSPAHIRLHTSTFPAVVSYDDEVEDPAGRGRRRVVNVKPVGRGAKTVHGGRCVGSSR